MKNGQAGDPPFHPYYGRYVASENYYGHLISNETFNFNTK
jgi:hypothetical protein